MAIVNDGKGPTIRNQHEGERSIASILETLSARRGRAYPATHAFLAFQGVDARDERGHDG